MLLNLEYFIKRVHNRLNYYEEKVRDKVFFERITNHFDSREYCVETFNDARCMVENLCGFFISFADKERVRDLLNSSCPNFLEEIVNEAEAICNHFIRILGTSHFLGPEISWHKDYVSGFEWPLEFYRDIKIINLSNHSDIKFPWELSRFHHAIILGKVFWLTGDEKYADQFIKQIHSWVEENPPNKGVNWNCAMEVAIRAVNLIWGYFFFRECTKLSNSFHIQFYNLILMHGKHICRNLENKSFIKGNHYIANLMGLLYISTIFPIFKYSKEWKEFSVREIVKEMESQVHQDGTDFEGSISYHRLVTEMFFHATYLLTTIGRFSNQDKKYLTNKEISREIFGENYTDKLEKMFEFIMSYMKPDGLAPQIGDNDCGRIVYLGALSNDINDHRHLLAVGGEFFDRNDFRCAGRKCCEDAIWFFKRFNVGEQDEIKPSSKAFNDSGIYILREDNDYMIIRCGEIGSRGKGTHTHNDNLSFELCSDGITYIIDPGTYVYSGEPLLRNLLRSTKYHNTLLINGEEQNDFSEVDLFTLHKKSEPRVLVWKADHLKDIFVGEIGFFLNKKLSVKHIREIIFNKREKNWHIKDSVYGKGQIGFIWNFHLNVGIEIEKKDNKLILTANNRNSLVMEIEDIDHSELQVTKGWYSPLYRVKREGKVLTLSLNGDLPREFSFCFYKNEGGKCAIEGRAE